MNTSPKFEFSTPFVPVADPQDGLVRTVDLGDALLVDITLWNAIRPGFYVQLTLDRELVGDVWTMSDMHRPGDVITLKLDSRLLAAEGQYELGFLATNPLNGVSDHSATTPLLIDRAPPGGSLMGQIFFAQVSFGNLLKGRIPSYAGMAADDVIQTVCNGTLGPIHRVRPENLTTKPIEITFTKELMEGLYSDKVNITYHVTDRAGIPDLIIILRNRPINVQFPTIDHQCIYMIIIDHYFFTRRTRLTFQAFSHRQGEQSTPFSRASICHSTYN